MLIGKELAARAGVYLVGASGEMQEFAAPGIKLLLRVQPNINVPAVTALLKIHYNLEKFRSRLENIADELVPEIYLALAEYLEFMQTGKTDSTKADRYPEDVIYALYNSGDLVLKDAGKYFCVKRYERYIYYVLRNSDLGYYISDPYLKDVCIQGGYIGLFLALSRWDIKRGRFTSFCTDDILARAREALRNETGISRLEMETRRKINKVRNAGAETNDPQVIARLTGMSAGVIQNTLNAMQGSVSMDAMENPDMEKADDEWSPENRMAHQGDMDALLEAIRRLPEKERDVVASYVIPKCYGEKVRAKACAATLGMSVPTFKRIKGHALARLRGDPILQKHFGIKERSLFDTVSIDAELELYDEDPFDDLDGLFLD